MGEPLARARDGAPRTTADGCGALRVAQRSWAQGAIGCALRRRSHAAGERSGEPFAEDVGGAATRGELTSPWMETRLS